MSNNDLHGKAAKEGFAAKNADPKQLEMGIKIEMEHTDNPAIAKKIAIDHLAEFSTYYTGLKKLESQLKKQAGLKMPVIEDKTTPIIIATSKSKTGSSYKKVKPFIDVAKFHKAKSKKDFIQKFLFGEAQQAIAKTMVQDPVEKIAYFAYFDELEKLGGIPSPIKAAQEFKLLMSKTPLMARLHMNLMGTTPFVKRSIEQGHRIGAINMVNSSVEQLYSKPRPRMRMATPTSFPYHAQEEATSYRRPSASNVVATPKFETKEFPDYTATYTHAQ